MQKKKFKNIKAKKDKKFKRVLKQYNLSKDIIDLIEVIDSQNILVSFFKSLIRHSGKKYRNFRLYMYLIKLYTVEMYLDLQNYENRKAIINEINKSLNYINEDLKPYLINNNYEEKILKKFKPIDDFKKGFDKYYSEIASVFSTPFIKDDNYKMYYKFSYLLMMYINLDLYYNKYNVPNDTEIFRMKLYVQVKMIEALSIIIPKDYNSLIISLNKWLKKYELEWHKIQNKK